MKYVFEFTKTGDMIYISHLDLGRLFLRALRMSGLTPAYSHGFNPHPKQSFALPLSLGLHSTCELFEFETVAAQGASQLRESVAFLNERLPDGVRITAFGEKPDAVSKALAACADAAVYEFMCDGFADAPDKLAAFFARESVLAARRDKKTGKTMGKEIRPEMIGYGIVKNMRGRLLAEATLAAAAGRTLNPVAFFTAFCADAGVDAAALSPVITRTAILARDGKPLRAKVFAKG